MAKTMHTPLRLISLSARVFVCSVCAMLLAFIVLIVTDFTRFRWGLVHRNDYGALAFLVGLYCIAVAGVFGAVVGAFTTRWRIEGKWKFVIVGILSGVTSVLLLAYVLGVLARILNLNDFSFVVTYVDSRESQVDSDEYIVRHLVLLIGLPVGAFLGVKAALRVHSNRSPAQIGIGERLAAPPSHTT